MLSLEQCTRIGILGGTFNPIHMGHLIMAEYAKDFADLDTVIIMPSGKSYLKANTNVLSAENRLEMVELSIRNNPHFISSDMEIRRGGNTYTYETLLELSKKYPKAELFFIVGADSLFSMEKWVEPQLIFENCTIMAAGRNHSSMDALLTKKTDLEEKFDAKILLMDFPQIDISSTNIRDRVRNNKSIRYMVHDNILKYIYDNNLYKNV